MPWHSRLDLGTGPVSGQSTPGWEEEDDIEGGGGGGGQI